jgi:hypothetical protein
MVATVGLVELSTRLVRYADILDTFPVVKDIVVPELYASGARIETGGFKTKKEDADFAGCAHRLLAWCMRLLDGIIQGDSAERDPC